MRPQATALVLLSFFAAACIVLCAGCTSPEGGGPKSPQSIKNSADVTARSALRSFDRKNAGSLALKARGEVRNRLREMDKRGDDDPEAEAYFSGWRRDAVQAWEGRIREIRFWAPPSGPVARAYFADCADGRLAVVVLEWAENRWWYLEISDLSQAEWEGGALVFPTAKPPRPVPAPAEEPEHKPVKPAKPGPAIDLSGVDRGDAKAVVEAILALFKARNLALLSELCLEDNRAIFAELGAKGEAHPRWNSIFKGWRWQAVEAWSGAVHEVRYWRHGDRVQARAHFGETSNGRLALVVLWFQDGRWWFEDINSSTPEKFGEGALSVPEAGASKPAGMPGTVDLTALDRTDVKASFQAVLVLLRMRNFASLLEITYGERKAFWAALASGGESHPGYRYFFSGWRSSAIESWDGSVGEIRYWRTGDLVKAEVKLGTTEGRIIVLILVLLEERWWFVDLVSTSETAFSTGAGAVPPVIEYKSVPDLVIAAYHNQLDKVKELLAQGADPESVDQGWTALLFAAQNGHAAVVEVLLSHGADMNVRDKQNVTPMYMAAQNGHMEAAKILAEWGADPKIARSNGWTPLHLAADRGSSDFAALLIGRGAEVDARENDGWTPLQLAAQKGHAAVAELLLGAGADPASKDNRGFGPLHVAALRGHKEFAALLLDKAADANARTNDGWAPIVFAAQEGHAEIAKLLMEKGAEPDKATNDGWTALHLASQNGHSSVIEALLSAGADVNAINGRGWTPLMMASHKGQEKAADLLLAKGADANITEDSGWTALHLAAQDNRIDIAEKLIAKGADVNAKIAQGATPLDIAEQKGHGDMLSLLEKHGGVKGE